MNRTPMEAFAKVFHNNFKEMMQTMDYQDPQAMFTQWEEFAEKSSERLKKSAKESGGIVITATMKLPEHERKAVVNNFMKTIESFTHFITDLWRVSRNLWIDVDRL